MNRMVNSSIWSQKWFSNLQKDEKYLFLYLLTSSHTNKLGIYEADLSFITFETGLQNVKFLLKRLSSLVAYDEERNIIAIRDFVNLTGLAGAKVEKGIYGEFERQDEYTQKFLLKECPALRKIITKFMGTENIVLQDENTLLTEEKYPIDTISIPYTYPIQTDDVKEKKEKEKEKEKDFPPLIEEVENTYIGEEEPSEKQENIILAVKEKEIPPITPKEKEKENILSPQEKEKEREKEKREGIEAVSYETSSVCDTQTLCDDDVDVEAEILSQLYDSSEEDTTPSRSKLGKKKILPPEEDIRVPYKKILELFNEVCGTTFHKVEFLPSQRRYALQRLYKKFRNIDKFRELFEKAKASPFLRGENKSGWRANFDWILEHAFDILEGKYDEQKPEGYFPEMEIIPIEDLKYYVSDDYLQLWRELVLAEKGFETGEIWEYSESVIEEYKQDIELFKKKHRLEKVADFPKRREAYLYVYEKRKGEEKYLVGKRG